MNYKELIDYLNTQAITTSIATSTADTKSAINDNNISYPRLLIMHPTFKRDRRAKWTDYNFTFYLEDVYNDSEKATTDEQTKFQELIDMFDSFTATLSDVNIINSEPLDMKPQPLWADNHIIALECKLNLRVKEC